MKRKRKKTKASHEFDDKWDEYFSKIHTLSPATDDEVYFDKEELQCNLNDLKLVKDELNKVKSKLNDFDIVKWHQHTRLNHLCGNIVPLLTRHVNVELGSQAFAKFYTILSTFDLFPNVPLNNVNTVHLCEAPGSFVTSLNHYFRSHYGDRINWTWYASTLNPYHEGNNTCQMIDDDRFIIETLPQWDFGPDFTGNIMTADNLNHFENKFKNVNVLLVTADGSTDCSEKPDQQESLVSPLLLWETITALKILSEKGCFVLKMFTIFERFSLSLLYLLHSLFSRVTLIKPGPSKPGNSEVYVVCEGFSSIDCSKSLIFQMFVEAAINRKGTEIDITDKIPKSFLLDVFKYVVDSSKKQQKAINDNISSFENHLASKENLKVIKDYFAKRFLKEFSIYPIQNFVSDLFVLKCKDGLIYNRSTALNFKRGSYLDRIQKSEQKDPEKFGKQNQKQESNDIKRKEFIEFEIPAIAKENLSDIIFKCDLTNGYFSTLKTFKFVLGKNIEKIYSSCFMASALLKSYFDLKHQFNKLKVNNICADYHSELDIIHQTYPDLQIAQKKSILFFSKAQDTSKLVNHYNDKEINIQIKEYSDHFDRDHSFENANECLSAELVVLDCGSIDESSKDKTINLLMDAITNLKLSSSLALLFDGLVFTSFWHGIFLLVSSLFTTFVLINTNVSLNSYYLLFTDFKASETDSDKLVNYLKRLRDELLTLPNSVDVLHSVDIYFLMQSNYRKYFSERNRYFAQLFVTTVLKLV